MSQNAILSLEGRWAGGEGLGGEDMSRKGKENAKT